MQFSPSFHAVLAATAAAAAFGMPQAGAQNYPNKAVRLIVAQSAGSATDVAARVIATPLAALLKQQVVVDNRAGAGGLLGTEIAAKAPPDGYTLIFANISTHGVNPALYRRLPYDAIRDFAPIGLATTTPNVLVVNASLPAKNTAEMITLVRNRPGQLNVATPGSGSSQHLAVELFMTMAGGLKSQHVPYKGSGPASIDLGSGQIDLMFSTAPAIMPMLKVNRIRGLAVATPERFSLLPDLPTMQEAGVPNFVAANWYGILAPTGTPRPVVDRLHADLVKITALPDIKQRLSASGLEPKSSATPQAFGTFLRDDVTRWERVIREANIKL